MITKEAILKSFKEKGDFLLIEDGEKKFLEASIFRHPTNKEKIIALFEYSGNGVSVEDAEFFDSPEEAADWLYGKLKLHKGEKR